LIVVEEGFGQRLKRSTGSRLEKPHLAKEILGILLAVERLALRRAFAVNVMVPASDPLDLRLRTTLRLGFALLNVGHGDLLYSFPGGRLSGSWSEATNSLLKA